MHTGKWLKNLGEKAKGKVPKWLTGPLRRAWDRLKMKGPEFLRDPDFFDFIKKQIKSKIEGQIKKFVEDFLKDLFKDLGLTERAKQFWREFLQWIASFDPVSIYNLLLLAITYKIVQYFISCTDCFCNPFVPCKS